MRKDPTRQVCVRERVKFRAADGRVPCASLFNCCGSGFSIRFPTLWASSVVRGAVGVRCLELSGSYLPLLGGL